MNLFESIYYDLLLEGKSPEEILGILKYKFKNVPEQIIDYIFSIDPTKKKSYTTWVLTRYDQEKHVIDNAMKNKSLKRLFKYLQEHQDAQLSKYNTLEEALYLVSNIDLLQKDSDDPRANDFDIVYQSDDWVIAVPNTYEADHKLGENTKWCTAGWYYNEGEFYYNKYLEDEGGKYFINFDFRKNEYLNGIEYPFTRYQFHFESNQFMDAEDDRVSLEQIDMPDEVYEFYEENGYDLSEFDKDKNQTYEEYMAARLDDGLNIINDYYLLQPYNANLTLNDDAFYYLYNVSDDPQEEIYRIPFNKQPLYYDRDNGICVLNKNTQDRNDYNESLDYYEGDGICEPCVIADFDYIDCGVYETDNYHIIEYGYLKVLIYCDGREIVLLNNWETSTISTMMPKEVKITDAFVNKNVNDYFNEDVIIEIVWSNGYRSLLKASYDFSELNWIIKFDKPYDGDMFYVYGKTEKDLYIYGQLRKYNIFDYWDDGSSNTNKISEYIREFFDGAYVLVGMSDGTSNIFNTENKSLVFKKNFQKIRDIESIEKTGLIIGNNDNGMALYSILDGEKKSDYYSYIYFYNDCFCCEESYNKLYVITKKLGIIGPVYSIISIEHNRLIAENEQSQVNIFDLNTGRILLANIQNFVNFGNLPIFYGNDCLYNYITMQLLDRQCTGLQCCESIGNYVLVEHHGGKKNIINYNTGERLFSEDVDEISLDTSYDDYRVTHDCDNINYICFKRGNTEYILHIEGDKTEVLPTVDGIKTGDTTDVNRYFVTKDEAYIKLGGDYYSIVIQYRYKTNEILVNGKNIQECEPELKQFVMEILYPQKAQFVAQYNEMIRRMKNLIR